LRECRLQFLFEIGPQRIAPVGVLAFGLIRDPAVEFGEEFPGMQMLAGPGDSVSSGHVFLFSREASIESSQPIGI